MSLVAILLLVVLIIVAILLVIIVLLQDDGGEGLGGIFGGGATQQAGSRSGNIITRITSLLAAIFIFTSLGLAWVTRTSEVDNVEAAARALQAGDDIEGDALRWWEESIQLADPDAQGEISPDDTSSSTFLDELLEQSGLPVTIDNDNVNENDEELINDILDKENEDEIDEAESAPHSPSTN